MWRSSTVVEYSGRRQSTVTTRGGGAGGLGRIRGSHRLRSRRRERRHSAGGSAFEAPASRSGGSGTASEERRPASARWCGRGARRSNRPASIMRARRPRSRSYCQIRCTTGCSCGGWRVSEIPCLGRRGRIQSGPVVPGHCSSSVRAGRPELAGARPRSAAEPGHGAISAGAVHGSGGPSSPKRRWTDGGNRGARSRCLHHEPFAEDEEGAGVACLCRAAAFPARAPCRPHDLGVTRRLSRSAANESRRVEADERERIRELFSNQQRGAELTRIGSP